MRAARRILAILLLAILLLTAIAHLARPAALPFALPFYLPLLPLAAAVLLFDLATRGQSIPRARFVLTALALITAFFAWHSTAGRDTTAPAPSNSSALRIMQWNVRWGGGKNRTPQTWQTSIDTILAKNPDILILSEAPDPPWVQHLLDQTAPRWNAIIHQNDPADNYWFRIAVCSRYPIRKERIHTIRNGTAIEIVIDSPARPIRLLAVDGKSDPFLSRQSFGHDIAQLCASADPPIDLIAGDFNTPLRSRALDALAAQQFRAASDHIFSYRATYPANLPLYDIDHIFLAPDWRVAAGEFFRAPHSNHRGQLFTLWHSGIHSPPPVQR